MMVFMIFFHLVRLLHAIQTYTNPCESA